MAVMDRPGTLSPVDEYACTCEGFTSLMIERMCIRCLDVYTEGLPHVLKGQALQREMRRVASCLAHLVKEDPTLGSTPVWVSQRV